MPDSLTTPVRIFGIPLTPRVARGHFAVQALAGAAWWVLVVTMPDVQRLTLGGLPPLPVAILDLPLFVGASALAAFGIRWAVWLAGVWTVLVTAAMVVYATATGSAGWGAVTMIAAAVGSAAAAVIIVRGSLPAHWILLGPLGLREARPRARANNFLATAAQLVIFWGLFLAALPSSSPGSSSAGTSRSPSQSPCAFRGSPCSSWRARSGSGRPRRWRRSATALPCHRPPRAAS